MMFLSLSDLVIRSIALRHFISNTSSSTISLCLVVNNNNIKDTTNKDISPNICEHISDDIPINNQLECGNIKNNHIMYYSSIVRNTTLDDGLH